MTDDISSQDQLNQVLHKKFEEAAKYMAPIENLFNGLAEVCVLVKIKGCHGIGHLSNVQSTAERLRSLAKDLLEQADNYEETCRGSVTVDTRTNEIINKSSDFDA